MSKELDYPKHWMFALASVLGRLEELVWRFDADKEARGHAYADVPEPDELIAIIDGFISEGEWFYQGDITNLKEMRAYLEEHTRPMFQAGQETARQLWRQASIEEQQKLAEYDFPDFRNEAKSRLVPNTNASQQSWFVEGFCKTWRVEWMEYFRRKFEAGELS